MDTEKIREDILQGIVALHADIHNAAAVQACNIMRSQSCLTGSSYEVVKEVSRVEAALHRKLQNLEKEISKFLDS